ncbi:alpha-L-rhamnosidase [Parasegetibacter sp. NRK P23]|uniref:alpha-L-rhamnosidase n=1 Tax=Parasegetibacter sp. NRK P23 TaxID=2942999 RepID=UPI00204470A0|nr:alpha-L-rhamnosidase [Parasegetibacter sp. NRK P23]MCM5530466.1 glycoside hydrolase family 78 protein [Parasegetibacter sp. NRK P23]
MKKNILLFFLLLASSTLPAQQTSLFTLRCEHLPHPIGIDAAQPRLQWEVKTAGKEQSHYRIMVDTDSAKLAKGSASNWNTGKIASAQTLVNYQGKKLGPFTRYYWKVEVWTDTGKSPVSSPITYFETGMMEGKNWQGAWISDGQDMHFKTAPYFRKSFQRSKKIRSARVYIAAAGLFELSLNGEKTGNHRLDPMYTRFDKRNLYVTFDVTQQLKQGNNSIGLILGNGWYNHQSTAVWNFHKAGWRARPSFLLNLRIQYADCSVETIATDTSWKTTTGPITFNSIYTAEHYDARLEQKGWNTPSFNDTHWRNAIPSKAPSTQITAQTLHPIRDVEEIPAISMNRINDSIAVFNLGRNISGVSSIRVKGPAGTIIRMKHGERLLPNGRVDLSNIDVHYRPKGNDDPFQTDIFILPGNGEAYFKPRFNYKGFQYVEVQSSQPVTLSKESLTGHFMHSDVPSIGHIRSSNPTLNKIWEATNNAYLSNLFGYPTDCPQREKNGWTGDAHIAVETGLYSYDAFTIYEKWMADHRDEQQPNGVLPSIIPTWGGWGYDWGNGPDWTSTIAIIPWNLYLFYGDAQPLRDSYPNMKKYVDYINEISPSGLTDWGLGDWVPVKSVSPKELTSSIYYFVDATILSETAKLLGNLNDHTKYETLAQKIRNAINTKYLDTAKGIYGSGLQTELSAPLCWGIVPDALRAKVAANLHQRVAADGYALDVGILGAKAILNALSENGYANTAYQLAARETYPSWGWWVKNGATTLYENWDINAKSDISLNHIMFGEIGAWLYKGPGGIKPDPAQPGFKNVLLQPHFVDGLESFEASHCGPYGEIVSSWKKEKNKIIYNVEIPFNSTAALRLPAGMNMKTTKGAAPQPNGTTFHLSAGTYTFELTSVSK